MTLVLIIGNSQEGQAFRCVTDQNPHFKEDLIYQTFDAIKSYFF